MLRTKRHLPRSLTFSVGVAAMILSSSPAQAQFDMGMGGMGMGMGFGFHQVPSPTGFLNQAALTAAGRPRRECPPHALRKQSQLVYQQPSRSRICFTLRDAAATGAQLRTAIDGRAPTPAQPQTQRAELLSGSPIVPLLGFFDASQRLIWPSDSPTNGELKESENDSDQATLIVLEETRRQPTASISRPRSLRKKLLDYGRPVLEDLRASTTPAISDAFHMFLLSLDRLARKFRRAAPNYARPAAAAVSGRHQLHSPTAPRSSAPGSCEPGRCALILPSFAMSTFAGISVTPYALA